jgi:hypothetical protein
LQHHQSTQLPPLAYIENRTVLSKLWCHNARINQGGCSVSYKTYNLYKRIKTKTQRFILGTMALALPVTMALSGGAALALDGNQANTSQCSGSLVINVTQSIRNDADSGVGGNYWANDNYNRNIKVWQTAPNTFCVVTQYDGQFTTYAGASPQNTGTVGAGVTGNFSGGYTATFTGTLNPSPSKPTHGNIGTFNYNCDASGNCPGYVSWTDIYFTNVSNFNEDPWGWTYVTCNNGSWVNASTGNSGDITGNASHKAKEQCHENSEHHDNGDHGHNDKDKHHGPRD